MEDEDGGGGGGRIVFVLTAYLSVPEIEVRPSIDEVQGKKTHQFPVKYLNLIKGKKRAGFVRNNFPARFAFNDMKEL